MKKKDVKKLPKDIDEAEELKYFNSDIWNRGYFLETDDGVWYEVYVNDKIKKKYSVISLSKKEDKEVFGNFHDIMLEHYNDYNQITFFVPNDESEFTFDKLEDILIK